MTYVASSASFAPASAHKRPTPRCSSAIGRYMTRIVRSGKGDFVSVGEITDALAKRDRAVLLLLPALLAVSPATIAFGVATVCGLMVATVAFQLLFRRRSLWLPKVLRQYKLSRYTLIQTTTRLDRVFSWLERHTTPRLSLFVNRPFRKLALLMSAVLGLAMPFLELVPLSATLGGLAITLMVLGLLLRDGLVTLVGVLVWASIVLVAGQIAVGSTEMINALQAEFSQ